MIDRKYKYMCRTKALKNHVPNNDSSKDFIAGYNIGYKNGKKTYNTKLKNKTALLIKKYNLSSTFNRIIKELLEE